MFKSLTSIFISFSMIFGPMLSSAQTTPVETTEELASRLIGVQIPDPADKSKKLNMAYEESSEQMLREFMPSNLYKALAVPDPAKALGNAAGLVGKAAKSVGNNVVHTTMRFGPESSVFFIAMGGVMTLQLALWYAENPISLEQHLATLKDPVSHISFYSFMLANGFVSNSLSAFSSSTTMRHFIPYLGMSAGMLTSSVVGELIGDPDFQKCIAHRIGKPRFIGNAQVKGATPGYDLKDGEKYCDLAYEKWVIGKKINQYMPGLMSMMASTAAGGALQWGMQCLRGKCTERVLTAAAKSTGTRALAFRGLSLGISLIPGVGWGLRGGQFVYKIVHFANFLILDQWIFHPLIKWPYGNITDGSAPGKTSQTIARQILDLKNSNWQTNESRLCEKADSKNCDPNILLNLRDFADQMNKWREFNLEHVMLKHHNWTQQLANLTGNYGAAFKFYSDFIVSNESRLMKNAVRAGDQHPLDRIYPFWGVNFTGTLNPQALLDNPNDVERNQMKTIRKAVALIEEKYPSILTNKLSGEDLSFLQKIKNIHGLLSTKVSEDQDLTLQQKLQVASGLEKFNELVKEANTASYSTKDTQATLDLQKLLGNPTPLKVPGLGYLASYEFLPKNKQLHSNVIYGKNINGFATPNISDRFIYNMVCGADVSKGEKLVTRPAIGFSWEFNPPKITKNDSSLGLEFFCDRSNTAAVRGNVYRPFATLDGKTEVTHSSLLDYLKKNVDAKFFDKGNKLPEERLHSSNILFQNWWLNFVQSQFKSTVEGMAAIYESDIVPEFLGVLKDQKKSFFNKGGLENSVQASTRQELKFYLMLLGEMTKDLFKAQYGSVPYELYDLNARASEQLAPAQDSKSSDVFIFIRELSRLDTFNFDKVMALSPVKVESFRKLIKNDRTDLPLHFQSQILGEYDNLIRLFDKLEIREINGRKRLTSQVTQNQFEKSKEKIQEVLEDTSFYLIADEELLKHMKKQNESAKQMKLQSAESDSATQFDAFGEIKAEMDKKSHGSAPPLRLTLHQMEIVEYLKNRIGQLIEETAMYGQIVNAVNYEKINTTEKQTAGKCVQSSMMSNPMAAAACRAQGTELE